MLLHLSRLAVDRPIACLLTLAVATVALATRLPQLEMHTDGALLQPTNDHTVLQSAEDRRLFADPDEIIILLTPRPGGLPISTVRGLQYLANTHRSIASLPGIRSSGVRSAAGLVDVAKSGVAVLGRALDEVPSHPLELSALIERIHRSPTTSGLYLARDGSAAAIYAPLALGAERGATVSAAETWAENRTDSEFEIRLSGPLVAESLLGERVLDDLLHLTPVMVLVVGLLLVLCLRSLGGLVVAIAKILLVLLWTGGGMALGSLPVTLVTTILPVLLLAMSVTDEVQVITRLQARLAATAIHAKPSPSVLRNTLLSTLSDLRRPVVYTSLSTAIGFLSFSSASVVPLQQLGAVAAGGILVAMFMTFTSTPALAMVVPISWWNPRRTRKNLFEAFLRIPGGSKRQIRAAVSHWQSHRAALAGLAILGVTTPGLLRLSVEDSWIGNFDPQSSLVQAERAFNSRLWGTYRLDVVLSGPPGFFHHPRGIALLAAAAHQSLGAPGTAGVVTALDPLDTVAELLGLADTTENLSEETLRAVIGVAGEHSEALGLDRLVTADGSAARVLAIANSPDYARARVLADHMTHHLPRVVQQAGAEFHLSGDLPLAIRTVRSVVDNQIRSIVWTLLGVSALLYSTHRRLGLLIAQITPSMAAIWLILSGMGFLGQPLGVATSMFAALAVGVGVDLALHVSCDFERRRALGTAIDAAIPAAFAATADGRRWSTLVLSLGFLVLTASDFAPNQRLGALLCVALLASHLFTSLFVPSLLQRSAE